MVLNKVLGTNGEHPKLFRYHDYPQKLQMGFYVVTYLLDYA